MKHSLFNNITHTKGGSEITTNDFFNGIKFGKWQILAEKISAEPDQNKRKELKKHVPYVTVSGLFEQRADAGLVLHSDLIAMDFDKLDPEQLAESFDHLQKDPYTFGLFRSISKTGICAVVQIEGKRHREAFLALEEYYLKNYGLIVDKNCKDISRPRYVSFDPELFTNDKSKVYRNYLPKKELKPVPNIIFSGKDIELVFGQIADRRIDLTNSTYDRYLKLAFALQSEFGEGGRQYFHLIAANSEKYDPKKADKQFDYCMRSGKNGITIATFFHWAKEAGVQITSNETQAAAAIANQVKKAGRDQESAKKALQMEGIEADEVVQKVFESNASVSKGDDLSVLSQLELFLNTNYRLKRNAITRNIETSGFPLETKDFNSIYIKAKKFVSDKINFQDVERLINSEFTEDYNPILDFFDTFRGRKETGLIKALADTIESDTGLSNKNALDYGYKEYFIAKWLVGLVASAHGQVSPLMLALTGGQNTGKTEFFRRLLPDQLMPYYAESKLDAGKDDEILLTQKLLVMDDELGGKTKQDEKRLKELTSKKVFTLREPYGKKNVDLKRLAVLAGTTNETAVLNDATGNRRIIPINVISINHKAYNKLDKVALLMEAFHLYQAGYEFNLSNQDIERLNGNTAEFEQIRPEYELILQYFKVPESSGEFKEYLTASQIKSEIELNSGQKVLMKKLGEELKHCGFIREIKKVNGKAQGLYKVVRITGGMIPDPVTEEFQKVEEFSDPINSF